MSTMRIANLRDWAMAGMAGAVVALSGTLAMAEEKVAGQPVQGGTGFQRGVTVVAHDIHWLDNFLFWIITAISVFVMALLLIVIVRYNRKANPTPATFTHNPMLEIAWTVIPVVILVVIAIPSLRLLFLQLDVPPNPDVTIKATGNQWYWSYSYPDEGIEFDSVMVASGFGSWDAVMADATAKSEVEQYGVTKDTWRLATDTKVVVPVGKVVHVLVTGSDVIHSWTVPSFGSKIDAVPGRLNETWFKAEEEGTFYGQCSELCGINHAYMPIEVEVVSQEKYDAWLKKTKTAQRWISPDEAKTQLAAASN